MFVTVQGTVSDTRCSSRSKARCPTPDVRHGPRHRADTRCPGRGARLHVMTRTLAILAVPVVIAFVAASCGGDDDDDEATGTGHGAASNTSGLADSQWTLDDGSLDVDLPEGVTVTAVFTADTVLGKSGCNTYNGGYTTTADGGLVFGNLASTRMACPEDQMAVEGAFFAAIGSVASYAIDGESLVMSDADGDEVLRFTAV